MNGHFNSSVIVKQARKKLVQLKEDYNSLLGTSEICFLREGLDKDKELEVLSNKILELQVFISANKDFQGIVKVDEKTFKLLV